MCAVLLTGHGGLIMLEYAKNTRIPMLGLNTCLSILRLVDRTIPISERERRHTAMMTAGGRGTLIFQLFMM